jgi:hypothetical protein
VEKIQLINYGTGLYELINPGRKILKVDGIELPVEGTYCLNEVPKVIEYKVIKPGALLHYIKDENIVTLAEYRQILNLRLDDEDVMFETTEDRDLYNYYVNNSKAVYSEPETVWVQYEIDVLYKEFIPDEYKAYISSDYVYPITPYSTSRISTIEPVKAICSYVPYQNIMLRSTLVAKGFEEVENNIFNSKSKGKKFEINDGIKFSKINETYISKYFSSHLFKSVKGSFEECKQACDRDLQAVTEVVNMFVRQFEEVPLDRQLLKDSLDTMLYAKEKLDKISVSKSYKDDYNAARNSVVKAINNLIKL